MLTGAWTGTPAGGGSSSAASEPYVSTDIARDPNYAESQASKLGIRGVIMVPLRVGGEEIGCLYIGSFTPRRFTDDDVRVACVFAQQIAAAVANASLLERERRAHSAPRPFWSWSAPPDPA